MKLAAVLTDEQAGLNDLLDLLRREQDLLVAARLDGEALAALADHKSQLLESIHKLEQTRLAGVVARDNGEGEAARTGCLESWQSVQDLARRCAHLNRLNGSLIASRLAHNQRVLRDIRQVSGSPLYQADGQTQKRRGRIHSSA